MNDASVTVSPGCARMISLGRKTMLRQVVHDPASSCPAGKPGDRVSVRAGESRIEVVIEDTRLERLHDIRDDELEAEGGLWREFEHSTRSPREAFARWWDSLHARAGTRWDDNPFVWVVTFRVS